MQPAATHDRLTALFAEWIALDNRMVALRAEIDSLRFPDAPPIFPSYEAGAAHVEACDEVSRTRDALQAEQNQVIEAKTEIANSIGDLIHRFPSPVEVTLADGTVWYVSANARLATFDIRAELAGGK